MQLELTGGPQGRHSWLTFHELDTKYELGVHVNGAPSLSYWQTVQPVSPKLHTFLYYVSSCE